MNKKEFRKELHKRGYASYFDAEDYVKTIDKDTFTEDDLLEAFNFFQVRDKDTWRRSTFNGRTSKRYLPDDENSRLD